MFDLEAQIRSWRQNVSASLGDRPDVLDELEGHLRDDFDRLVRSGERPESAWSAAVARIGTPEQLAREFAKVDDRRPGWLPARVATFAFIVLAVTAGVFVVSRLVGGRAELLLASHVLAVTVGYGATFVVGGLAAWSVISRALGGWDAPRAADFRSATTRLSAVAMALTLVGVALGAWWAGGHLGRYWDWDAKEVGGLCVLAWNGVIYWAVHRRRVDVTDGMAIAVGVAGNIVVSLAWFAPPFFAGAGAQPPRYGPYLLAFLAVQVLLLIALSSVRSKKRVTTD
jgi:hypothetical protein